jgi:hypothetical protein
MAAELLALAESPVVTADVECEVGTSNATHGRSVLKLISGHHDYDHTAS